MSRQQQKSSAKSARNSNAAASSVATASVPPMASAVVIGEEFGRTTAPSAISDRNEVALWPGPLRQAVVDALSRPALEREATEFMSKHHWPTGLQQSLIRSCSKLPLRFFIVDDSGISYCFQRMRQQVMFMGMDMGTDICRLHGH